MRARRIISLLPSATEMVCSLDLEDRLVGRSHECDHPASVGKLPVLTRSRVATEGLSSGEIDRRVREQVTSAVSLYEVDWKEVRRLKPDLILTQDLCLACGVDRGAVEAGVAEWVDHPVRILNLAPARLADLWPLFLEVAEAAGVLEEAREIVRGMKNRCVDVIQRTCMLTKKPTVACLEWLDPLMTAGHWTPEMVALAGGEPVLGEAGERSTRIDFEALAEADPDLLIVIPCGFPLDRTRREWAALVQAPEWGRLRSVQTGNVFLADGNAFFNRPGPRLVETLEILAEIAQPKLFPARYECQAWERWNPGKG